MQQPPGPPNNPYGAPPQPQYGQQPYGQPGMAQYDPAEVQQRLKKLNNTSLMIGGPGLLLQIIGSAMGNSLGGLAPLFSLAGTGLLIYGLTFYVRSRGYHWALAFLGLFSCLGLVVLALVPRKCIVCKGASKMGQCVQCGAPVAQ